MAHDWDAPTQDADAATIREKTAALREEHRRVDQALLELQASASYDQITIMRLKRRKLCLKDEIAYWEDQLTPDIIA